jgi:hypothetical protein
MTIDQLAVWTDITSDIASVVAVIIGGIWVYRNYLKNRTSVWNLKIAIRPESYPYQKANDLLKIDVALMNAGKTVISPGSKGCQVTVRRLSQDTAAGQAIDLDAGDILFQEDILRRYYRSHDGYKNYEIEPGAEYHEMVGLAVVKGDLLSIRAEFNWQDNEDSISEYNIFRVA